MEQVAEKQNILKQWFVWWILEAPRNILLAWKNFLLSNFNYFSIGLLLKTLFAPWRKYKTSYGRGFNLAKYLEAFVSNLIFRSLGAIIRFVLIIIGLLFEVGILVLGFIIFILWIFSPFLLIGGFLYGIKLLF